MSRIHLNSVVPSGFAFMSITVSPVFSDPATPACLSIISSLSPGFPRPSPHLQLISSLVHLYLYQSTCTCSLPDCLVIFAKLSRGLLPCFAPILCLFTGFWISCLPLFGLFACMTDLPFLTLFARRILGTLPAHIRICLFT